MPALVTTAPILIDPIGFARQFGDEVNPMGFFAIASALYLVLAPDGIALANVPAEVWKSTNGSTWNEQDPANRPTGNFIGKSCIFNPATGIISILIRDNTNNTVFVAPFDTGDDQYDAVSVDSPPPVGFSFAAVYQQSGGTIVVPTNSIVAAANKLRELDLTAGVWAGPNQLGDIAAPLVYGCVVDALDRGHLFYADAAFNLQYALISVVLTLGAPVQVASSANWDGADIDQRIWNNQIVVAFTNSDILYIAIGSPLSGAVFTVYTVGSVPSSGNLAYPALAVDRNGKLVVFAAWTDFSVPPYVDQLLMWTFDGASSFGSPALFYDEIANPPANSVTQLNQFIHTGAAYQFANGTWVYATALEVRPANHTFCAGHILIAPVANVPTVTPGDGGRKTVVLTPNQFDFCLHREYRLFCNIDYDLKGCARLPKCFTVDEREWGESRG